MPLTTNLFLLGFAIIVASVLIEHAKNIDPTNIDLKKINIHQGMAYFALFVFLVGNLLVHISEHSVCKMLGICVKF